MRFGHFDDKNREYIINQPDTPLPWINYLGSEDFFGLISNTAGGYTFYRDARLRRLTRYRYNNVPYDNGGRYLYLRDNESGEYWSPTWQPTRIPLDSYTCRHGMGYTIIDASKVQIATAIQYFIPRNANVEIWKMTIKNNRKDKANLSVFSLVEFCLWDALDDATNFQRNFNIGEVEIVDNVIYHKTEYRERRDHFAFFACSSPIDGFDTDRASFLGAYHGFDTPQVVQKGKSNNSIAHGWAPIGSHHVQLTLSPGEEKEIIFLLGYQENPQGEKYQDPEAQTINKHYVQKVIDHFVNPKNVSLAFDDLKSFWRKTLQILQVETPDEHTNRMVNIWNAYQCMVTFNMSRSASYFESGIGRGMGFRDSAQDLLGFVYMIPERARERILDIAATQLPDGGAYHQYQPLTKRGNHAVGSNFNDDPLWLVLSVAAYLKETGDFSLLDEQVPFNNETGSEERLYNHLQRSIQYTLDRLGPNNLPLIGRADWNDCLNLNCFSDQPGESFQTTSNREGGVAESVMIAGLFVIAAKEMQMITHHYLDPQKAIFYHQIASKMEDTVLANGWDGEWFKRAYDYFGSPIGSHICEEGKIFIEAQGMCVMAGIGLNDDRAIKALDSVEKHLATQHGIVLLQPAYTRYYLNLGEISSYPPGYKENGSVFCHTNPWIMIAEAKAGRGEKAFDYYMRINPSAREKISEIHRCEPYVYAQTIAGKDAPSFGEAKNSWLTGTAAWNFVAISQWILGIRADYEGLIIDPVIPADWPGFSAHRKYRGKEYQIIVERANVKAVRLLINNEIFDSNLIPDKIEGPIIKVLAQIPNQ